MLLIIDFNIEKPQVLYQESPICAVAFSNAGPATVRVPRPVGGSLLLSTRVVEVKTGVETLHRKTAPAGAPPRRPVLVALEPGKRLQGRFSLRELMPLPPPGKYEISVLCDYNNAADHAESRPVALTVEPTTARNLSLVSAQGGAAAVLYGAWMNVVSDPPDIVRSCFDVIGGGGVSETVSIAKGTVHTRPILSVPPNGESEDSHWIAWLDERNLHATHYDPRLGPSKIQKLDLGLSGAELVEPLFSDVTEDSSVRPPGAALVFMPSPGNTFRLTTVELTDKKFSAAGHVDLPGKHPAWIQTLTRGNRSRALLYLQQAEKAVEFSYLPWPSRGVPAASAAKSLFKWQGQFVGAGATLNDQDQILGATLMWQGEGSGATLQLFGWKVDPKGTFSLAAPEEEPESEPDDDEVPAAPSRPEPRRVIWNGQAPIERCLIRLNERGQIAALLLDAAGRWQVFDGAETKPVPAVFSMSKLPLDLGFLGAGPQPVLIAAELGGGFRILQLDGRPLPPKPQP